MRYIRTKLATDWGGAKLKPAWETANPSYADKYHLVDSWLIEFDEDELPWREIGLDANGKVVLAGPSVSDYGFWLDTNMQFGDFVGEAVSSAEFEALWSASGVVSP